MKLIALHGFLGLPSDWEPFSHHLPIQSFLPLNLWELYCTTHPKNGLHACAKAYNQQIITHFSSTQTTPKILMGYSLGGRLALHMLLDQPTLWQGAILISAHPGLPNNNNQEKNERLNNDSLWAKRFLNDPWESLLSDWNTQSVFAGKTESFERLENSFSRQALADALIGWSLGTQENLVPHLQKLLLPILWITGANDSRNSQIAKTLTFKHPRSKHWQSPLAAHRVPWEDPLSFHHQVRQFLIELNS